jgi:ubiquinone/menaquinone biosynthesis C-methylase UbiE
MNPSWDDARTAEMYAEFTRSFPMYDETSRDLVRLADVAGARRVVDLCCGTGATTAVLLEHVGPDAEIVAIDGSPAMLEIAQRTIDDNRVRWVLADASALADHASDLDAIVCNSAIWQTDIPAVLDAAARALRPGGRLAFNVGRHMIMLPFTPEETSRTKPTLGMYMQAIATLEYDYVPPLGPSRSIAAQSTRRIGGLLSEDSINQMLETRGLRPTTFEIRSYTNTPERERAWFSIPIFANNVLDGMPYDAQLEVIEKAYERVDKSTVDSMRWAYFVAVRN